MCGGQGPSDYLIGPGAGKSCFPAQEEEESKLPEIFKLEKSDLPEHLSWLPEYLQEVEQLVGQRGKKYGPGNIEEFGELGVLVRLSDKLARLRHTTEHFEDETSADSWMDVIGYGLIGLAWCRGDWPGSERK